MAFNGDFLPGQERLMDLIFKTVLKMQRERIKSVEAKPEAIVRFSLEVGSRDSHRMQNAFMEYVDEYLKRTVHAQVRRSQLALRSMCSLHCAGVQLVVQGRN
jgi:hypothetical protein